MIGDRRRRSLSHSERRTRAVRPRLEGLENRFLLYATTGTQWARPKRITYSFVPDGTSIGGVPSNLQASLNARFNTADWMAQFARAAAVWQKVANVNFNLVPDNGVALGVTGNQQSDTRFGDIRIGGYDMTGGVLAFAYLAPPANGGTNAGDMFFNTAQAWQINGTTYDLMSVAVHEFGHAIGIGHSTDAAASMYPTYTGAKQLVNGDDTSGIRSIYNSRQNDFFDANGANNRAPSGDVISSYIDSNGQLTLSALDSTTPVMIGQGDFDWYKVTVPSTTTGTMAVRMQSTGLSLLAPTLAVYDSAAITRLGQAVSTTMGDTVTVTINNVSPGQVYNIRSSGTGTGDAGFGAYGLQVNFGSQSQPPVTAPDTYMAETVDQGGGTLNESTDDDGSVATLAQEGETIPGVPTFWVYDDDGATVSEDNGVVGFEEEDDSADDGSSDSDPTDDPPPTDQSADSGDGQSIVVGDLSGQGDAIFVNGWEHVAGSQSLAPWAPRVQTNFVRRLPVSAGADSSLKLGVMTIDLFPSGQLQDLLTLSITTPTKNRRPTRNLEQLIDLALAEWDARPSP